MAYDNDSYFGQLALKVGLPTPVPDRWDTVSDEVLEQYILGFERVLDDPEFNDRQELSIVSVFNEHVKARHKKYFDVVAGYYLRAEKLPASELFFTLKKMCGSSRAMADRMLEVYNTDPRWFKHYFYGYFAERGTQKYWDVIANDATTAEDIRLLKILAKDKRRLFDKNNVDPWIPELPGNKPE